MDGLAMGTKGRSGEEAIGEYVGILFMARNYTHKAHLKTPSYAAHAALNGFYDSVVGFADASAEQAQGKFGKSEIEDVDMIGSIDNPIKGLEMQLRRLNDIRSGCSIGSIKNEMDAVEGLYLKTLYLLKELS